MSDKGKEKSFLKSKYEAIAKRSFKTKLELLLFTELLKKNKIELTPATFTAFVIDDEIINEYQSSWQKKESEYLGTVVVKEFDEKISAWPKKEPALYIELLKSYQSDFEKKLFPKAEFEKFYGLEDTERKCRYCGISERQIKALREGNKIQTKRSRGKYMEVDRKNSNKEYTNSDNNLILACYYCNNAKTDEFDFEEFKIIRKGITEVWNQRLESIKQPQIIVEQQTE